MDRDRNLLVAAFCLRLGFVDSEQFSAICRTSAARPDESMEDLLVERGWLRPRDRPYVEYLVDRCLHVHANDARAATVRLLSAADRPIDDLVGLAPEGTVAYSRSPVEAPEVSDVETVPTSPTRYAFTSIHASGGMGQVWRARDLQLDRDVALKELRADLAADEKIAARFVREARLTGQLEHPGIVPVYELTTRPGSNEPFYTMRFVRGRTLTEAIRAFHSRRKSGQADPLELVVLLTDFVAVCHTIAYAHSKRVLHRDLKGDNVILGDFGEVVVLDWGVAKRMDQTDDADVDISLLLGVQDAGLTLQGDIIGTPAYMSPEQAEGRLEQMDERTDVYGLGAMLYEILTGRPPFVGHDTLEVIEKAVRGNPLPPREYWPEIPRGLDEICLKAMSRDPANRFAHAEELAQAVQQWQDTQRRRAEDALRRQTEVLRSILNSMSEGVLVADETGKILLANPAAERMIGPVQEAASSGTPGTSEFLQADQVTPLDASDLPLARAIGGDEVNDVEMYVRPKGRPDGLWASANARPLRDEAGALRGGVMVLRDVSERKRAEAELLRSRERFELAVLGSQDGLWDWDPRTGEIYYSPRWKSIIGYEDHEIAHRIEEWEERLHPDDRERVLAANKAHLEGDTSHYECEYRLRHKNGTYRWILARGVALRDATGAAYRAAGSHVDITERKQAEEERARSSTNE